MQEVFLDAPWKPALYFSVQTRCCSLTLLLACLRLICTQLSAWYHHLTLRYTYLEFDSKGNLSIYSDGKAAYLSSEEIVPLLTWLISNKNQPIAKLQTSHNAFLFEGRTLIIDGVVRIFAKEVGQMCNWAKKWQKDHREVFIVHNT